MRIYYVFIQDYKLIDEKENEFGFFSPVYKLLPWEYYGFCIGTRALYEAFKDVSFWHSMIRCEWTDSFEYEPNTAVQHYGSYRALVMDDAGHIRDFYELTKKFHHYRWKNKQKHRKGYHYHYLRNVNERKQELTPDEIKEFKLEFDMTVPDLAPDRKADAWDYERFVASGGSWKDQSRKNRQYGNRCKKLSRVLFDMDCDCEQNSLQDF